MATRMMTETRGVSNAKARRDLGWAPAYPSVREGFRTGLDPALRVPGTTRTGAPKAA
jgi:hypothetical protein